jgi:photosystem II stability/assembly factor-like uncharacterized protein
MRVRRLGLAGTVAAAAVLALSTGGTSASVSVSQSGWAWGNPSPQGNTLRSIAFAGSLGYAVGDNGTALKTLDGGATWTGLATGTSGQLTRVQIVEAKTVIVGSANGCIVRISTDGGVVFTRIFTVSEEGCTDQVQAFSFVSPQVGYLLLRGGSVLVTHDGGNTFSRETGVPGTAASSGGGSNVGIDTHFTGPLSGIVFVGPSGGGRSAEYATSDGGVSWTPIALPSANVTSIYFLDPKHAFAIGPNTLLRSTDGGATWTAQPIGASNSFSSIDCANTLTCVLTVSSGDHLVRTADGGASASVITPSSAPMLGAAYSTETRVVAVGGGGTAVISNDGGVKFEPGSSDIGGQFFRLRSGPGSLVYAPGANGLVALSTNGGASWGTLATQTSADLLDVSFASASTGYALDTKGGLQLTTNGGASWKTLAPGTTRPAHAVAAVGNNTVLLVGPVGIFRSRAGGRFNQVGGNPAGSAHVSDVDVAGTATLAFGARTLILSTNSGAAWRTVRLPLANKRGKSGIEIRSISFVNASSGLLLDGHGRLWETRSGGRSWKELLSTGSSDGMSIAFSDLHHGFMTMESFGQDSSNAYVLRTSDGGTTWHPQLIAAGRLAPDGLVVNGASSAHALLDGPAPSAAISNDRLFFYTASGGDAGAAGALTLSTKGRSLSTKKLRRAGGAVKVNGVLTGALGGEQIVVSRRNLSGGDWTHQLATAGANGGSFSTTWHIGASSVFVAQWAGDSGRASLGSAALRLTVRAR